MQAVARYQQDDSLKKDRYFIKRPAENLFMNTKALRGIDFKSI
jgi:hypothetical protein